VDDEKGHLTFLFDLGKPQKITVFFIGPATMRGWGVRAWPLRKKSVFEDLKKILGNFLWPLCSKALVTGPLKKYRYFFAVYLTVAKMR